MEANPDDENIYDHIWATEGTYRASLDRIPDSNADGVPSWFGFVRVADIEATVARVPQLGGFVLLERDPEIRGGRLAVVRDPAGSTFVVLEYDPDTENPT
jgi:predicted enzyme related to lactoylglutathione lyase